ncbi:MAG: FMN-binding protein [Oscillospiraceae bacterium]|nr:FMN-binding protein [Oscillospiraceae bacterium]
MAENKFTQYIKPPLVLCVICFVMCFLIVGVHKLTYVDTTGIITDSVRTELDAMIGDSSDCVILPDFEAEGVNSVIVDKKKHFCAFEITVNGYAKDGLNVLVGIKNGEIIAVKVLSCKETEGVGTIVTEDIYLSQFIGIDSPDFSADIVSGATFSSEGMINAISIAMNTYNERKGDIFSVN